MKITLINSIYKPEFRGGTEVVVENIVNGLKKRGHQVAVVCVGRENISETIDGVEVCRIKPFNLFNFLDINSQPVVKRLVWHVLDMFNFVQNRRVLKALKKQQPDLILTHNLKGLGYGLSGALKSLDLPWAHTVHDMQLIHPSGLLIESALSRILAWPYKIACRCLFRQVKKVIFPSVAIEKIYLKNKFFKKAKSAVINNPLDLSVAVENKKAQDKFIFAFVGQIEEHKGVFDLVKAFKQISGNVELHFAGSGKVLEKLKDMSKDDRRIIFHGRLSQGELVDKIWSKADVLVNPSLTWESFGMVVVEAYCHGVPVLASKIGALSELVEEGKAGWLLKPGNIDQIVEKMKYILENKDNLESMRSACRERAGDFNLENYFAKLEKFVEIDL